MGTKVYLSHDKSDVTIANFVVYKAYVGFPSPNASTTVSTAVTNTTASGSDINMTDSAGGTDVLWITMPFLNDVAFAGRAVANIWAKESNASANAQVQYLLKEYTTSAQSAFQTSAFGTELTTSIAQDQWSDALDTPTTVDAGNRLIIQPQITNSGTMGASQTVTMDYNGSTTGADGDTYIMMNENILIDGSQFGNGAQPLIAGDGPSTMPFGDWVRELDPVVSSMTATPNAANWGDVRDELLAQCGEQVAGDPSLQSA